MTLNLVFPKLVHKRQNDKQGSCDTKSSVSTATLRRKYEWNGQRKKKQDIFSVLKIKLNGYNFKILLLFAKGNNFYHQEFAALISETLLNIGATLKGKNLLPSGSKFFPPRLALALPTIKNTAGKYFHARVISLRGVFITLKHNMRCSFTKTRPNVTIGVIFIKFKRHLSIKCCQSAHYGAVIMLTIHSFNNNHECSWRHFQPVLQRPVRQFLWNIILFFLKIKKKMNFVSYNFSWCFKGWVCAI